MQTITTAQCTMFVPASRVMFAHWSIHPPAVSARLSSTLSFRAHPQGVMFAHWSIHPPAASARLSSTLSFRAHRISGVMFAHWSIHPPAVSARLSSTLSFQAPASRVMFAHPQRHPPTIFTRHCSPLLCHSERQRGIFSAAAHKPHASNLCSRMTALCHPAHSEGSQAFPAQSPFPVIPSGARNLFCSCLQTCRCKDSSLRFAALALNDTHTPVPVVILRTHTVSEESQSPTAHCSSLAIPLTRSSEPSALHSRFVHDSFTTHRTFCACRVL